MNAVLWFTDFCLLTSARTLCVCEKIAYRFCTKRYSSYRRSVVKFFADFVEKGTPMVRTCVCPVGVLCEAVLRCGCVLLLRGAVCSRCGCNESCCDGHRPLSIAPAIGFKTGYKNQLFLFMRACTRGGVILRVLFVVTICIPILIDLQIIV